jgi:glycosyltransferase involved in cell wall biosynthesis
MKISVIIPVYNAEKYLRDAVESALKQDETAEVILVEDRSPDDSIVICRELAQKHNRVILYRHPDEKNHGAGQTRNLGIMKASYDYIAFLDADDFYMPGRFTVAKKMFEEKEDIDGLYEAVGVHCQDESAKKIWAAQGDNALTILSKQVDPKNLFDFMLSKNSGTFHLDGVVVKKELFQRCGYFFKNLRLHQDTAMAFQMSLFGNLYPGRLTEPVAKRRVHDGNRFFSNYNKNYTQFLMWQTLFKWARQKNLPKEKLTMIFINYQFLTCRLMKTADSDLGGRFCYLKSFLSESLKSLSMTGNFLFYLLKKY